MVMINYINNNLFKDYHPYIFFQLLKALKKAPYPHIPRN